MYRYSRFKIESKIKSFIMIKNTPTIKEQKVQLRKMMLEKRDKMPENDRKVVSQRICSQLWSFILENKINVIHSYLTMGSEVNVLPLLQMALDKGLTVITTKTLKKRQLKNLILTELKNMEVGIFGTYHPKDAEEYFGHYDLIIVAGSTFDRKGNRIGYGGGYYDTFLAKQQAAITIGVCYPFQLIENIPVEEHDIILDNVVS
jgi:5-formyltetrahydrofolate cyclo-ligase